MLASSLLLSYTPSPVSKFTPFRFLPSTLMTVTKPCLPSSHTPAQTRFWGLSPIPLCTVHYSSTQPSRAFPRADTYRALPIKQDMCLPHCLPGKLDNYRSNHKGRRNWSLGHHDSHGAEGTGGLCRGGNVSPGNRNTESKGFPWWEATHAEQKGKHNCSLQHV